MSSFNQKVRSSKLIGWILIMTAIFGWLVSLAGTVALWAVKPVVSKSVTALVSTSLDTLNATSSMLQVIEDTLDGAGKNLALVSDITGQVANAVDSTTPLLNSLSGLVGTDLVNTVTKVQESLVGLQATAKVIDTTLALISRIPFVSNNPYNPEVPLDKSVSNISTGMADLPVNLKEFKTTLTTASASLTDMPSTIHRLAAEIDKINASVTSARDVVAKYQSTVDRMIAQMEAIQKALPVALTLIWLAMTMVFVWMACAQLGFYTQGVERLQRE
jgi:methyl-accepting chemotaxis protein